MSDEELAGAGLSLMTDAELRASTRYASRAGHNVEVWHDPEAAERMREVFGT
jgi:hypothetical protein